MRDLLSVFRMHAARRWRPWLCLPGLLALGCVEQAEEKPTAEDMEYVKQNLLKADPTPQHVVNADLDGKVTYLGCDVTPNPGEAGKDMKVVHYWKVHSPPGDGWRAFAHLNGPNGTSFVNVDHGPVRGKYPVSQWKAGDIVRDEHGFRVPATWAHPVVEIYVGLWRKQERMAIKSGAQDGQGRVLAARIPVSGGAAAAPLKRYLVRKLDKQRIKLDGKLDEAAWKAAPSTGAFVNTMTGGPAEPRTEAKLLWDDKTLYIGFENADPDVWTDLKKRDDKLWTQEAVEIMIDANGDGRSYVEFQVAPNGTIFDTYLPEYRKYEDSIDPKRKPFDWSSGIKVAVQVEGTLNKRDDQDKGWTVEIALPLSDVKGLSKDELRLPPALGDTWRLNFFRMDQQKDQPQTAQAWSPPLVGDFHKLDRFGEIVFADAKGEVPAPAAAGGKDGDEAGKGGAAGATGGVTPDKAAKIREVMKGLQESVRQQAAEGILRLPSPKQPAEGEGAAKN